MFDLKALLALLVVGQLGLPTAGRRHHPHHDDDMGKSDTKINRSSNEFFAKATISKLLTYTKVEKDVETLKNRLIHHRDAPVPAGKLPIANRKSRQVGQYVVIVWTMILEVKTLSDHLSKAMSRRNFGKSRRKYVDDYKSLLQPVIIAVTHIQDVLEPVFKLIKDLSKETDPSQQMKKYLKFELDNKPYDSILIKMIAVLSEFLKAVYNGPVAKENVLVERGAERYVKLNEAETEDIAFKAWEVLQLESTQKILVFNKSKYQAH